MTTENAKEPAFQNFLRPGRGRDRGRAAACLRSHAGIHLRGVCCMGSRRGWATPWRLPLPSWSGRMGLALDIRQVLPGLSLLAMILFFGPPPPWSAVRASPALADAEYPDRRRMGY